MHFLWFKYIKQKSKHQLNRDAQQIMVGQIGMVTQNQVNQHITLRFPMPILGSDEWPALCVEHVVIGDKVQQVTDIKDHLLIVKKQITSTHI